jgi:GT2 family glycosyltransferase
MKSEHPRSRRWRMAELELSEGIRPIATGQGYHGARILVRRRGRPVGWLSVRCLAGAEISELQIREALAKQVGWQLLPVLLEREGEVERTARPTVPISVVVCTRNRTQWLEACLQALRALDYPEYEIIVVDNAPSNDDTARLVAQLPVRYVREDRPGLDWARNRGIAAARYDLIAFTDDDARPDRHWLQAMAAAFAQPDVMAVTGFVAPTELDTEAQVMFELGYGGMGHGFQRRAYRENTLGEQGLLWASGFGVGANMAFRRKLFAAVGLFDVALDVGTPSGGGGDVEMFHRLVANGFTLVYEPAALVWHTHRREMPALRQQLYDNGRGFASYLLTCARNRSVRRRLILRFAIQNWLGGWILRRLTWPGRLPRRLVAAELAGALRGPWAYRAAQVHARRTAASGTRETA